MSDKKYIEVNEFIKNLHEAYHTNTYKEYLVFNGGIAKAKIIAKEMPAADVEEVRHGYWKMCYYPGDEHVECSECHTQYYENDLYLGGNDFPKRCPECGAHMDKGCWCDNQQLDENHEVICLAHLAEGRALKCPYRDAAERETTEYPCSDYEPKADVSVEEVRGGKNAK